MTTIDAQETAMSITPTTARPDAAQIVEEYFSAPIRILQEWADPCAEEIAALLEGGALSRAALDALVEPYALRSLDLQGSQVHGAGFIAAIDLLPDTRGHLAWWQVEDRRRLLLASQSVNKEYIDYRELEWYRVPLSTGLPHVARPYVDYLCSDEYTITIAVPVLSEETPLGVAGLDLLVSAVERELTPRFSALGQQVALVNSVGRVVVSTDPRYAAGDSVRGSRLADLARTPCHEVALDVIVEAS